MRLPRVLTKTVRLGGGLNLESPHLDIKEGQVKEADNLEPNLSGGYRLISGYERVDGRTAPSAAVWYSLGVADSSVIAIGAALTGGTSGATANVVDKDDTNNLLAITNLVGNFSVAETVGATTVSVVEDLEGQSDPVLNATWELAAQDYYRDLIAAATGTGNIVGVWYYNSVYYCYRQVGTLIVLYKSTASGWAVVTLYDILKFNTGDGAELSAGDVINGVTSAAEGTIKRVVLQSGTWGVDAAGYFLIDVTTAGFVNGEDLRIGAGVRSAVANGAEYAVEFAVGANKFRHVNYNFKGNTESIKMYGCDGVNNAFEFDGTLLTPIITGMATDAPTHIEAHKKHLFLAFSGGSLQHSSLGDPMIWSPILGASELALGDEISGIKSTTGEIMAISTDRSVHALYGSSVSDWVLQLIALNAGDIGNTLDVIGAPYVVTNNGITRLDAVQAQGNFQSSTVSRLIRPLLNTWIKTKTIVDVVVSRAKSQYQIYFNDGTGIIMAHDSLYGQGTLPLFTTFTLIDAPTALCSVAIDGADEVILMGDANGFVYQLQKGTSFDGDVIEFALRAPFLHLGSPAIKKAFKRLEVENVVDRNATIRVTYEFSYGEIHTASSASLNQDYVGSGGYYGSDNWSEFNWSSPIVGKAVETMRGSGNNVSVLFYGSSAINSQFTIQNMTFHYIPRRITRS